ncbi:MAG: hypothetical protein RMK65_08490 [Anaerolineae bacterium]|nr:hypothetical protein [Anaerolineae bacterium]MCX8067330.1 hypothetical protein [Anaerolineae bacterium]MDW7992147.1 hypothetical protein [Anaerolineae bacterium]
MTSKPTVQRPSATSYRHLVRWLAILLAAVGIGNIGRAIVAVQYMQRLPDLPLTVPLPYLAVTGAGWGIVLLACAAGLWMLHSWSRPLTLVCVALFQAHTWLNHLAFDASDYAFQTRPRDALVSLLFLALFWGLLNLRGVRRVFKERKDTKARRN